MIKLNSARTKQVIPVRLHRVTHQVTPFAKIRHFEKGLYINTLLGVEHGL